MSITYCNQIEKGSGLIEVLITMLILSIGLMGIGLIQAQTLQNNHSAFLRSQAGFIAYDILERIRANRLSARSGQYATTYGVTHAGANNCQTSSCTPTQLAGYDLMQWKANLSLTLPSGDGSVSQVATSGSEYIIEITVRWNDDRQSNVLLYKTLSLRSQL